MSLKEFFNSMEDDCAPSGSAYFKWSAKGCGFGQLGFYTKEDDDKVYCMNEMMSREFIKKRLCEMVDNAVMEDPSDKDKEGE